MAAAATLLPVRGVRAQPRALSAQDVVDRVRANVGIPWRPNSVDTFKAGDPTTAVTGVATTVMATLDVLRRAAAGQRNLVITHEPTFYAANDAPGVRANDPVYLAKRAFIDDQRLVVWRFSDHWHARQPGASSAALAAAMGWEGARTAGGDDIYQVPDTTLAELAALMRRQLDGVRGGIRVVGRPELRVRRVLVSAGTTGLASTIAGLPYADVVLAGEPREWEAVPYAWDSWAAGQGKGMIALGRVVSETPGMQACAAWLRSFVTEVPIDALSIPDPYWSPAS